MLELLEDAYMGMEPELQARFQEIFQRVSGQGSLL
jgi:hypothetical protein